MTNYLLLRDNKQSGPYTFEEIRSKGLKAYDLVWIEGKSAAWRYPCEIGELSAFAPAVEEQPFDRFFKKPVTPANTSKESVAATIVTGDPSSVPGKRIIYVTLPAGKNSSVINRDRDHQGAVSVASVPVYSTPVPVVTSPVVEDNYSQDQEHWKNDVEITPRIQRRSKFSMIGRSAAIVLSILLLLAGGIFIGMSINKDSLGFTKGLFITKTAAPVHPADHPSQALAVTQPPPTPPVQPVINTDTLKAAVVPVENQITSLSHKSKPAAAGSKPRTAESAVNKDSSVLTIPAVRRETSHRTDVAVERLDKDVVRNNLANLVSIGANAYTIGTFGGISDLQLTVSNHSVYPLDLVVVEVQYIQSNKKVFKTETLRFRGIPAGSALMQEAPHSSRGIKVEYKITQVSSKEPGLSYSAL